MEASFLVFRDAAVFFLFILTLASLFAVSSHITHKTQKKGLTKARCPILNGPDIFTHWFFTIHVWISNAPSLPLFLFFFFTMAPIRRGAPRAAKKLAIHARLGTNDEQRKVKVVTDQHVM